MTTCFLFVEILLFEKPPVDDYEYIHPCKYARSESAARSNTGSSDDDRNIAYDDVSPSWSTISPPAASSTQLYSWPDKTVASRSLSEDNSRRTPTATGAYANIKPCPDGRNLIQKMETREPTNSSFSPTPSPSLGDGMIYEVVDDLLQNLTVKVETKPRTEDTKTSAAQHKKDLQYTHSPVGTGPAKKPPPPTKPKSFKRKQDLASASASAPNTEKKTSVCRVNPVKSNSSLGRWKSARDVPADLANLSVEQVGECMELLHLPKLAAAFRSHDVDGKLLISIVSEDVLKTDFGCSDFDAKKVVQFAKNGWRPNE